jgi:hypothetical protein
MKKIMALSFFLLSLSAGPVYALRCGHVLVSIGDHKTEVRSKCGDPVNIDERLEYLVIGDPSRRLTEPYWVRTPPVGVAVYLSVQVEEWTYNFGPHQFMQLLRFENGILQDIRSLGYGY